MALLTLTALLFGLGSTVNGLVVNNPAQYVLASQTETVDDPRLEKYQTPADTQLCAEWSRIAPNTALASFAVPAVSDLTFFLARGAETNGNFKMNPSHEWTDYFSVNVTIEYEDEADLQKSKACQAGLPLNLENGVMLWASEPLPTARFNFTVEVSSKFQSFGDVSADFGSGAYEVLVGAFFDIWRPVSWGVQRFKTNNAPIGLSVMILDAVYLQTSNASIQGNFFGAGRVHLYTSNAAITSFTILAPSSASNPSADLVHETSNAPVQANFAFYSDYLETNFSIRTFTTNSEIMVMSWDGPLPYPKDPIYNFDILSFNSTSSVLLPSDYEGTFSLRTWGSGRQAFVSWDKDVVDPSGQGRNRSLELDGYGDTWATGKTYWGKSFDAKSSGQLQLRSTSGDVMLWTNGKELPWFPAPMPTMNLDPFLLVDALQNR